MALKNLSRIPLVLVLLMMAAFSSAQDDSCLVEEKHNVTLVSVHEPAHVLLILNNETSVEDCLKTCCRYKGLGGDQCTAISSYLSGDLVICVLLHCVPFRNCSWKIMPNYYAARISKESSEPTQTTIATTTTTTTTTQAPMTPASNESITAFDENDKWNVLEEVPAHRQQQTTAQQQQQLITTTESLNEDKSFFESDEEIPPVNDNADVPPSNSNDSHSENNVDAPRKQDGSKNEGSISDDDYKGSDNGSEDDEGNNMEPTDQLEPQLPGSFTEDGGMSQSDEWPANDSSVFGDNVSTADKFYVIIAIVAMVTTIIVVSVIMYKKFMRRGRQYRSLRDYDVRVDPPASSATLLSRE